MSQPAFAHGAIDLSTLQTPSAAAGAVSGSFVVEVDESNFESTLRQSVRFPVIVEFYSPRDTAGASLSQALAELAEAAGGNWLLGRINVDQSPQVAQALQIQAVPTVVGVLAGQMVPLWQGTLTKDEANTYITELLKVAAANGVLGKAEPVATAADEAEPVADPRYEAAYAAMESGDFAQAETEFGRLLAETPGDAEAKAGVAQAGLWARVGQIDQATLAAAQQAAEADPGAVDLALAAADYEVATGQAAAGFARLIQAISLTSGEDRDRLRTRLLALFETCPADDPQVLTARRNLTSVLF
ncbi:MAG: tetratricopeptide repeat protein [Propionibacteriaceae bacterium]|jgi:putative thioredoxin|nr:tetratricopeptide repeat protein [Propionibacteriaceae bacterium]